MRNLKPRLTALAPRIGYAPNDEQAQSQYRRSTQHWQQWYGTQRWKRLRWSVWVRDNFTCAKCHHVIADKGQLVCDHIVPHRGDERRFWAGPFQTLCQECHNTIKQLEERQFQP